MKNGLLKTELGAVNSKTDLASNALGSMSKGFSNVANLATQGSAKTYEILSNGTKILIETPLNMASVASDGTAKLLTSGGQIIQAGGAKMSGLFDKAAGLSGNSIAQINQQLSQAEKAIDSTSNAIENQAKALATETENNIGAATDQLKNQLENTIKKGTK